jgi:hypothetical protein
MVRRSPRQSDLADIARIAVDGIAVYAYEILADNAARQAQAAGCASQRSTRSCPEDQPPGNGHRFCAARCTPVLTSCQCVATAGTSRRGR